MQMQRNAQRKVLRLEKREELELIQTQELIQQQRKLPTYATTDKRKQGRQVH
jgi:hypothetical protein